MTAKRCNKSKKYKKSNNIVIDLGNFSCTPQLYMNTSLNVCEYTTLDELNVNKEPIITIYDVDSTAPIVFVVCYKYNDEFKEYRKVCANHISKLKLNFIYNRLIKESTDYELEEFQKFINDTNGMYHLETVTQSNGNGTSHTIKLNLCGVTSYIYDTNNHCDVLNLYNFNIKVFGLPDVYMWKNIIPNEIFNRVLELIPDDKLIEFKLIKDISFEKAYSYFVSMWDNDTEKVSKIFNLEI